MARYTTVLRDNTVVLYGDISVHGRITGHFNLLNTGDSLRSIHARKKIEEALSLSFCHPHTAVYYAYP